MDVVLFFPYWTIRFCKVTKVIKKRIIVASSLMDANVAPIDSRLKRAEKMIKEASEQGVELFLLPEMFNLGYAYDDSLFKRAEDPNGKTRKFLARCAKKYQIMLGGSWLVREENDIFNRLMLVSPEGEFWNYNKNFPWGWERGYFKGSRDIQIADTPLGKIGFLICWDVAHTKLWESYQDKVDLMLVCMSPPLTTNPTYHMSDGKTLNNKDLGLVAKLIEKYSSAMDLFTDAPKTLAKTLGVPVIASSATGRIRSEMPHPRTLWLSYCATNPLLLRYWNTSRKITADFDCADSAQIISQKGITLRECGRNDGDTWIKDSIEISGGLRKASSTIPKRVVPRLSYFLADTVFTLASRKTYMKRND